ncbi:MAG: hypothetical protein WA902_21350, partial [Thermosynechococcaceae cyanobacterium]
KIKMAKLIIEIPDPLLERVESSGYDLTDILPDAVIQYLETRSTVPNITQTQTWEMCGTLSIGATTVDAPKLTTNDAEHIDEHLYQGF